MAERLCNYSSDVGENKALIGDCPVGSSPDWEDACLAELKSGDKISLSSARCSCCPLGGSFPLGPSKPGTAGALGAGLHGVDVSHSSGFDNPGSTPRETGAVGFGESLLAVTWCLGQCFGE